MTDALQIFRFAVTDSTKTCCPVGCVTCCNSDPPNEFQLDATNAILLQENCTHCDEYAELMVIGDRVWQSEYQLCRYTADVFEDPKRCASGFGGYRWWQIGFGNWGGGWCSVNVTLVIFRQWSPPGSALEEWAEAYEWHQGVSETEDFADWVTVPWWGRWCIGDWLGPPYTFCPPGHWACQDVDPGSVRIKRV